MFEFLSLAFMAIFIFTRNRLSGFLGWHFFGLSWLFKVPHYLEISDYFNTGVMVLAFLTFTFLGLTIFRTDRLEVFISATSVALISSFVYFSFSLTPLKAILIEHTRDTTVWLARNLGFEFTPFGYNLIEYMGKYVEIILACTGIESMALFAGIAISTSAELKRRFYAFMASVPVIYVLNLLRNVFIVAAFGGEWFGPESFYIAHHVISKVLATIALIVISLTVFRFLPEFADMIFNLKDEVVRAWSRQERE
ncbi:archaeosortase A [Geoglobus acetivorans]|uniref:Archaeosortase A n=1 Tax=Geoglobus acetivorans TaxID=565033 RepID=A0ABZ3H598_GEOAI|nr:archaeosortase A [Geoglobus acetivorans]